jgi:hypothetical protein
MSTLKDVEKLTVGQFVRRELDAEIRKVAAKGNSGGYSGIYTEVARKLVSGYPNLSVAEKQAAFDSFKGEAELMRVRTHIDSTGGLGAASRVLGL